MIHVAMCWDDGPATDIRLAEICRKHGAKATFNLCPQWIKDGPTTVLPGWQTQPSRGGWSHKGFLGGRVGRDRLHEVYDGFEVASHCMSHETVGPDMPFDRFLKGAVDARKFLEDEFQKVCRGFAWPCGRFDDRSVLGLQEAGFAYGRTCEQTLDPQRYVHPMLLKSNAHFLDGNFWDKFQAAKENGNAFFYFWGHSYEMLDCEGLWAQIEEKIRLFSEDPDVAWANVVDIVS